MTGMTGMTGVCVICVKHEGSEAEQSTCLLHESGDSREVSYGLQMLKSIEDPFIFMLQVQDSSSWQLLLLQQTSIKATSLSVETTVLTPSTRKACGRSAVHLLQSLRQPVTKMFPDWGWSGLGLYRAAFSFCLFCQKLIGPHGYRKGHKDKI